MQRFIVKSLRAITRNCTIWFKFKFICSSPSEIHLTQHKIMHRYLLNTWFRSAFLCCGEGSVKQPYGLLVYYLLYICSKLNFNFTFALFLFRKRIKSKINKKKKIKNTIIEQKEKNLSLLLFMLWCFTREIINIVYKILWRNIRKKFWLRWELQTILLLKEYLDFSSLIQCWLFDEKICFSTASCSVTMVTISHILFITSLRYLSKLFSLRLYTLKTNLIDRVSVGSGGGEGRGPPWSFIHGTDVAELNSATFQSFFAIFRSFFRCISPPHDEA